MEKNLINLSKAIKFGNICYLKLFESFFSFEFICSWDWEFITYWSCDKKGTLDLYPKHVKTIQEGFFNLPSLIQAFLRVSYEATFLHLCIRYKHFAFFCWSSSQQEKTMSLERKQSVHSLMIKSFQNS